MKECGEEVEREPKSSMLGSKGLYRDDVEEDRQRNIKLILTTGSESSILSKRVNILTETLEVRLWDSNAHE